MADESPVFKAFSGYAPMLEATKLKIPQDLQSFRKKPTSTVLVRAYQEKCQEALAEFTGKPLPNWKLSVRRFPVILSQSSMPSATWRRITVTTRTATMKMAMRSSPPQKKRRTLPRGRWPCSSLCFLFHLSLCADARRTRTHPGRFVTCVGGGHGVR